MEATPNGVSRTPAKDSRRIGNPLMEALLGVTLVLTVSNLVALLRLWRAAVASNELLEALLRQHLPSTSDEASPLHQQS